MSNTTKVAVGKEVSSLDVSPQFDAYSGVEIIVNDEISYLAGNRNGRVLTIENPWGTQAQATTILNTLQAKGFQYQPYTAEGAILNPAAEIGDGITISDTYSGLYKIDRKYSPLMSADVQAPQDEELDHEYPYEPKQDRIYKRQIADAKAEIAITQNQISAEVTRATNAENSLSSNITQTANSIKASVLAKKGGSSSSFGWTLTDTSWTLNSSGKTVFKATSSGVEVSGKITATSGTIGGFTIGSSSLYNGMNNINSTANGVYVGTNGISVGGGKFKVTSSGSVSAANMTLTGTLTVGGSTITAANLRQGAERANSGYSNWNSAYTSTSSGGYCYKGAGYGYNYSKATNSGSGEYPSFFKATSLYCDNLYASGNVYINRGGSNVGMGSHTHIISVSGGRVTFGSPTNGSSSFNIADTQYYRDGVEAAYDDGYDDGYAVGGNGVTISSFEYTWHTDSGAGYHAVLTNGRSIYGSASF